MGRSMMAAIESGYCMLSKNRAHDYWGHIIPARDEVKPGSHGSYEFVADTMGVDWADRMAAL